MKEGNSVKWEKRSRKPIRNKIIGEKERHKERENKERNNKPEQMSDIVLEE